MSSDVAVHPVEQQAQGPPSPAAAPAPALEEVEEIGLLPVLTLVLWVFCLIVGWMGLMMQTAPRRAPASQPPPPPAVLDVEIATEAAPLTDAAMAPPQADEAEPPPSATAPPVPAAPPLPAVAAPSPAIAFAVPVEGPTQLVPAAQAVPVRPPPKNVTPAPRAARAIVRAPQLTADEASGLPKPEYPMEAELAGQTGTVVVEFTIGQNGSVTDAHASKPCRWPILNQACLRLVREQWHFQPGPTRTRSYMFVFASKQD